jgi:hypothetical protein
LRIWNKLLPPQKAEIEKKQERGHILAEIRAQNKSAGVQFQPFSVAEEKHYDAELDANKAFKDQLGLPYTRRVDLAPKKSAEAAHAKGEPVPKKFELRFTEFLYFEAHKPKPVSQKNLERFSDSCPAWLHSMLDSLSPDDARNYLTILYRQMYPEPSEMPADAKPATKAAPGATPSPARTNTKKSGPASPF